MSLANSLTAKLGRPIEDPEEETFLLYSRTIPSRNLGFIDPKAESVDVTIRDREFTVHQSPTILSSSRAGGTTGAVLWKITPLFADWISSPAPYAFLPTPSTILELGCGISPLNALALALNPTTTRCVLTDQPYVQKLVARNIEENEHHLLLSQQQQQRREGGRSRRNRGGGKTIAAAGPASIEFQPLDWETDSAGGAAAGIEDGFDLVLACDCVYNEALIEPLVQTCAEACALRTSPAARDPTGERDGALHPTVCMVAQQLRDNTVFESWLTAFQGRFVTWRVPDDDLPEGLRPDDGFVIYAGILRSQAEI